MQVRAYNLRSPKKPYVAMHMYMMNIAISSKCWFHVVSWNKICLKCWKLPNFTHTFGLLLKVQFWQMNMFWGFHYTMKGKIFFSTQKNVFFLGWKLKSISRLRRKQVMAYKFQRIQITINQFGLLISIKKT